MGFKHLICEWIVEFGVRVTHNAKIWLYEADYIVALNSKTCIDSFKDDWFCKRIQSAHTADVFDMFGFILSTCAKVKKLDFAMCLEFVSSCKRDFRELGGASRVFDNRNLSIKTKKSIMDRLPGIMSKQIDVLMKDCIKHQRTKSLPKKA